MERKGISMTKKTLVLLGFILVKFLLQYHLISPEYDLHRDEYLHLDQANHLAWGYQSVPPVTSWISRIIQFLGNSVFWVKFFPALFGSLTIVVVWKAIEELKGNLFAQITGATCILFSTLLYLNMLYQPNSLDVLCWTAFYYILIKYCNSKNGKWLFICAIVFAIGFLNKYNVVFLLIGLLPAILLTRQRTVFAKREFYFAVLLALILISPNLIWQYNNSFPVFHHLKKLTEQQLVNVNRLDFLKGQALFFFGSLFVIVPSIFALLFYKPFKIYRFYFWSLVFTLGVFIYFKAKSYYAIGLYPVYIAFGSVYLADILATGWKKYFKPVAIALPVLIFIPFAGIIFPDKSPQLIVEHAKPYKDLGLLRWEDGKDHSLPQDFADMLGWKELAGKVERICDALPIDENIFILCDNYGQAAAINYYTENNRINAVSFEADYINWFDLEIEKKIDNFIRVKGFEGSKDEMDTTSPFFGTSLVADSITNHFAREYKTTIFVFTKPKIDINQRLRKEADGIKNYR
jgi:hypothetical protein